MKCIELLTTTASVLLISYMKYGTFRWQIPMRKTFMMIAIQNITIQNLCTVHLSVSICCFSVRNQILMIQGRRGQYLCNKRNGASAPVWRKHQRHVEKGTDIAERGSRVNVVGPVKGQHFVRAYPQWPPVHSPVVTHTRLCSAREDLRCCKETRLLELYSGSLTGLEPQQGWETIPPHTAKAKINNLICRYIRFLFSKLSLFTLREVTNSPIGRRRMIWLFLYE